MKLLDDAKFDFNGLFIFEMANNHQGDVEHGKRIIREVGAVAKQTGIRAAVKLQFRNLETFVHPEARERTDNKHIQRFLSTKLAEAQFAELVAEIRAQGMISMCTPFDEPSVETIQKLGIEILKIGSCSAKDWPLLERAVKAGLPMIVSLGGLSMKDTDNLVSFLDHKYAHYALMHCVAIYPTPAEKLQLNHIARLRDRYPHIPVGFSTHEEPNNLSAIQIAYAKGARLFERHVGVPTETIKLNAYSSTPEQLLKWVQSYQEAVASCGPTDARAVHEEEIKDLLSLQRGVFAKRELLPGEKVTRDDIYFAFPIREGQLPSGRWHEGLTVEQAIAPNAALPMTMRPLVTTQRDIVYQAVHEIKGMLNQARISIGTEFSVELSHHYGIERFMEVGTTIIDCINREYCKKILVQLPEQQHPYHHHRKKEESFQVLSGELWVELEGRRRLLYPGDIFLVQRGVKHRFWTETGAIFEEVSTTHFNDDSIYDDPKINSMGREQRKTKLINWGRHQFDS